MLEEKIERLQNEFWTRKNEMEQSIENTGLWVAAFNDEYIVVAEEGNDKQAVLYLGHANETMWVDRIEVLDENGFEIEEEEE